MIMVIRGKYSQWILLILDEMGIKSCMKNFIKKLHMFKNKWVAVL
jgi:hypothetical protein